MPKPKQTKKTAPSKRSSTSGVKVGLGVLAATAAAGVAAYMLTTKSGKRWTADMQREIAKRMQKLERVSKEAYQEIIDDVAARYQGIKNIDPKEFNAAIADLKKHWNTIRKQASAVVKPKR